MEIINQSHFEICSFKQKYRMRTINNTQIMKSQKQGIESLLDDPEADLWKQNLEAELLKNKIVSNFCSAHQKLDFSRIGLPTSSVTINMFKKLASWMERYSGNILHFSSETFEFGIQIMLQYLLAKDCRPRDLQVYGCASLHLASKFSEPSLVSIDSHVDCCNDSFSVEKLLEAEVDIYESLHARIFLGMTVHGMAELCCEEILKMQIKSITKERIWMEIRKKIKNFREIQISPEKLCSKILYPILVQEAGEQDNPEGS